MLEGEAPKNAPTYLGSSILVAQKALPKPAAKAAPKAEKKGEKKVYEPVVSR